MWLSSECKSCSAPNEGQLNQNRTKLFRPGREGAGGSSSSFSNTNRHTRTHTHEARPRVRCGKNRRNVTLLHPRAVAIHFCLHLLRWSHKHTQTLSPPQSQQKEAHALRVSCFPVGEDKHDCNIVVSSCCTRSECSCGCSRPPVLRRCHTNGSLREGETEGKHRAEIITLLSSL